MEVQINKALGNIFNEKNREITTFGGYCVSYSCVYYPSIIVLNTWNLKIGDYHLAVISPVTILVNSVNFYVYAPRFTHHLYFYLRT